MAYLLISDKPGHVGLAGKDGRNNHHGEQRRSDRDHRGQRIFSSEFAWRQ